MEQFALAKYTGLEKPGRWAEFVFENSMRASPLKNPSSSQPSSVTPDKPSSIEQKHGGSAGKESSKKAKKAKRKSSGNYGGQLDKLLCIFSLLSGG